MGLSLTRRINNNFMSADSDVTNKFVVALAGNPNVGKSTIFNALTGLKQHTGNWPGKTVATARGVYFYENRAFNLVDVPGTYSMMPNSAEEEVARNFICFGSPDATIIVSDATCLERNLNLVLQVLEITPDVVVCVNLMDEACRKGIEIDLKELEKCLGVPVIGSSAREGKGLDELKTAVYGIASGSIKTRPINIKYNEIAEDCINLLKPPIERVLNGSLSSRWISLKLLEEDENFLEDLKTYTGKDLKDEPEICAALEKAKNILEENLMDEDNLRDMIVSNIVSVAAEIANKTVTVKNSKYNEPDRKTDRIVCSRVFGIPIMLGLLALVFWITIVGANYPSEIIASLFSLLEVKISAFLIFLSAPPWLHDMIVFGLYRTIAWVVSVMLPPMAIFFPLFTLLEDLGYLPRVAFNLDNFFKKACSHGKQALTMCMGFGCNAAGVTGCRIIDSPRERLIAIITNNFVPCNGRFPTLIAISVIFFGGMATGDKSSVMPVIVVTGFILSGVFMTLFTSKLLSKTLLKGMPSSFTLELPPYRKPQPGKILVRSLFDRTLFVLGRAVTVAAPAGLIIWIMANVEPGGISILKRCADLLEPFAYHLGMDGYILLAFFLGLPANEIVLPIVLMSYMSVGSMMEYESLTQLGALLTSNGWNSLTAICVMLFSLMHFPCGTTLWSIKKETGSLRWTALSFVLPTAMGIMACFTVTCIFRLFGWA
jgi:ferrous iron transport protein B